MSVRLETKYGNIVIVPHGRTLAIMEELAEMQKEIDRTAPGNLQLEINCSGERIVISIKTWRGG